MKEGFIFDTLRCVGCGACKAACSLRNNWEIEPRKIYWWNSEQRPGLPVFSVSLACNHCGDPACLRGCPAGAFSKIDNAVVPDTEKCIGCRYCIWNCPFDAISYEEGKGVVGKCHSCYTFLARGETPACASACPTGALSYGELMEIESPAWFPETGLKPSLQISSDIINPVEVYPSSRFQAEKKEISEDFKDNELKSEWSLVSFSFLSLVSASLIFSSLFTGTIPEFTTIAIILAAAISSFFHPGKPVRSWRSVMNLTTSPLSREILLFLFFSASALISLLTGLQWTIILSSVTGLALLAAIDLVYVMPDKKSVFHSGQVFLAGLMLISLLINAILPFSFIAALRIFLSLRKLVLNNEDRCKGLRFVRIALLTIGWTGWIVGVAEPGLFFIALILAGELADRILFYYDFHPATFREFFNDHYRAKINEKESGKQRPHTDIS